MIRKPLVLDSNSRKANLPAGDYLSSESIADLQEAQLAQAKALIGTQTEIVENHAFSGEDAANVYDGDVSVATKLRAVDSELQVLEQQKAPRRNAVLTGVTRIGDSENYTEIAEDGTLTLQGEATTWDDYMIPGFAVKLSGTSPPDLLGNFVGDNTLDIYVFDGVSLLEQVFFTLQMPHRWKEGSTIYPHVHVSPVSTNAGDTVERVIRFKFEYTWANIWETFGSTQTINLDSPPFVPNTSQWKHLLCTNSTGISGTGKRLSSMLVCRLYREPTDPVDTYPQDAAFLQFDIHYEIDGFGSTLEYSK